MLFKTGLDGVHRFHDVPNLPAHQSSGSIYSYNPQQPDASLQDHHLSEVIALEHFHASQIRNGYQLFNRGCIETAANMQNLILYNEERMRLGLDQDENYDDPALSQMTPAFLPESNPLTPEFLELDEEDDPFDPYFGGY